MKRAVFRIMAIGLSLGFGLVATEVILRVAGSGKEPHRDTAVPALPFSPRTYDGFRDMGYPVEKPGGGFRIAVLGDSFTWGDGVHAEDTYPKRLEWMLRWRYPDRTIEVLNVSDRGWNTEDEYRALKRTVLPHRPDLVILGYCLNDPEPSVGRRREWRALVKPLERRSPRSRLGVLLHNRARVFRLVFDRLENERQRRAFHDHYFSLYDDGSERWQRCRNALTGIRETLNAESIPLVIVIFPIFDASLEDYPYVPLHDKVAEFTRSRLIPTLDLLPAYEGIDPYRLAVTPFTNPHPNELAHRIASCEILSFVRRAGLLPKGMAPGACF